MYLDKPMADFLNDAAAKLPAPGGGAVSALAGALGTTMASMAANFTAGKKKYRKVEPEIQELLGKLEQNRRHLLELMQQDIDGYSKVSDAYAMPKKTDEEKAARETAVQEALKEAMQPPLEMVRTCVDSLDAAARLGEIGSRNLISDVGVAAILLEAAAKAAKLNVDINVKYIKDGAASGPAAAESAELVARAASVAGEAMRKVSTAMA